MMGRLEGKAVLITGTAGGQGAAAARLFAAEGAIVAGCDLDAERCEAVCAEVRAAGGAMTVSAPVDLADPDAAAAWVTAAVDACGGIDVLYNNASAPRVGPFSEVTYDDWRFTLRNELDLIFTVTSAAWPHLVARGGGVVINTASVSAYRGAQFIEQAAHGAASSAMTRPPGSPLPGRASRAVPSSPRSWPATAAGSRAATARRWGSAAFCCRAGRAGTAGAGAGPARASWGST